MRRNIRGAPPAEIALEAAVAVVPIAPEAAVVPAGFVTPFGDNIVSAVDARPAKERNRLNTLSLEAIGRSKTMRIPTSDQRT